jgi:polysaccharide chain length determinant protein (PEP-CTERM system associated)
VEVLESMEKDNKSTYEHIEPFIRRKWLLILPIVLCTAIAVYVSLKTPPRYSATTILLIEHQQVSEQFVTPTTPTSAVQRLNTIIREVMSRSKLIEVINDFNLYKNEENEDEGRWSIKKLMNTIKDTILSFIPETPTITTPEGITPREKGVGRMRANIEINIIEDIIEEDDRKGGSKFSNVFSISYKGGDPYVTMEVTNTLASLFIEENLKARELYVEGTSEFLISELENVKKELKGQEKALKRFKERHMGSLPEQLDANLRTLDRLQLELQTINSTLMNAEDRKAFLEERLVPVAYIESDSDEMGISVIPRTTDPLMELERLEYELSALLSMYKENYPDVVITRNRIKEIKKQLAAKSPDTTEESDNQKDIQGSESIGEVEPRFLNPEVYAELVDIKSKIKTLKIREAEIRKQIKVYEKRVEKTPANEQMLLDLQRNYNISLNNYQSLMENKLNASLAESLEKRQKGERFKVIEPAILPKKPFEPDKKLITIIGTLVGTGVGVGLVFLLEFLNPAFRRPEDLEGVLTLPVLTTIPEFSVKSIKKAGKKFKVLQGRKI